MTRRYSNLLSLRFRLYLLVRQRLLQWSITWFVLLTAILTWWLYRAAQVSALAERVALMEAHSSPLQETKDENLRIQQRLKDMDRHESLLHQLEDERVPYRLIALVSATVAKSQGRVQIQSFALLRSEQPDSARQRTSSMSTAANTEQHSPTTELSLTGMAHDNLAVSLFVASLRDTGVFQSVDLKSSVGARRDTQQTQTFIVHCAL